MGTAVSVLDNYSFPWSLRLITVTVSFVFLLFINNRISTIEIRSEIQRVVGVAAGIAMTIGVYSLINYPVYADMIRLDHSVSDASLMYRKNGFSVSFIRGITYLQVPEPEGYSIDRINDIMDEYLANQSESVRSNQYFVQTNGAVYLALKPEYLWVDLVSVPQMDGLMELPKDDEKKNEAFSAAADQDTETAELTQDTNGHSYDDIVEAIRNYDQPSYVRDESATPNIVVVMSEAFSDLRVLADYQTNTDYMPFIHSLEEDTIKGYFHASIIGGNTATSEFEFLTSDTMAFLPAGSVAYQQFVTGPMPTLNTVLEDQGYYSVAMHPYKPSGWERDTVYPYFSFDKIKFDEDFVNQDLVRDYISDEALFNEILMELDTAPADQPTFIFTVSMQNHGGYTKLFDNFEPDVTIQNEGDFEAVEQYLSLIKETDQALEQFITSVDELEEETIVLFFGDHQPNNSTANELDKIDRVNEESDARYVVPYLMWANFDIEEGSGRTTSLNYLAGDLLDAAGLQTSPYQSFLNDLQERIPVITQDYFITDEGERYYFNDAESYQHIDAEVLQLLNQYEILQYNHLIDTENRLDEIFEINVG